MTDWLIRNRLVLHIGGYDPAVPEAVHRRFVRELRRFEQTWSATASASELTVTADKLIWDIATTGPNWRVHTRYQFIRWDDVMDAVHRRPIWQQIPLGLLSLGEFLVAGAFWGYLRTAWRYALFFLYPIVLVGLSGAIAGVAGLMIARASGYISLGVAAGLAAFAIIVAGAFRRFYLAQVFEDWIFSRNYIHRSDPILDRRFDQIAQELVAASRSSDFDEILVVGHSIGAVLAVDLLDRALKITPALGSSGPRVGFLSLGSSILKIGLHRGAERLRAALKCVGQSAGLFWVEYQVVTDVMNFYKTDPMAALGLPGNGRPIVRVVRFRDMLDPAAYRRIRRNFFRLHNQFIKGNDRRAAYDYFMLVCGPLAVEPQIRLPHGISTAIGADGAVHDDVLPDEGLRRPQAVDPTAGESRVRLVGQ